MAVIKTPAGQGTVTGNMATTKVLETLKAAKATKELLQQKIGRGLGSPINGYEVGDEFNVTLTGDIEIREYAGRKSAYLLSKQGISIAVNAAFDSNVHKADSSHVCICREIPVERNGESVMIKFASFKLG